MDADAPGMTIRFRPLQRRDFPLLSGWLAEPVVRRWWNHDPSPAAVERDFGPSVDGLDRGRVFVASRADRAFGLAQHYMLTWYADYAHELGAVCPVPADAAGIDYLIGEPDLRGAGVGTAMVAAFLEVVWRDLATAGSIYVAVSEGNRASWRALASAGFARAGRGDLTPDNPMDPPAHLVYRLARPSGR